MSTKTFQLPKLDPAQFTDTATSVAGGYGRRMAERGYDWVFDTKLGRRLVSLPPAQRYALELVLYLGKAALERNFNPDHPAGKLLKELLSDAAPELSRRLINGYHKARSDGAALLPRLLALAAEPRDLLMGWLRQRPVAEQAKIASWLASLDNPALEGFVGLSEDEKTLFLTLALASEPAVPPAGSKQAQ